MLLKHWQAWAINHLSWTPVPVFDHPLDKEINMLTSKIEWSDNFLFFFFFFTTSSFFPYMSSASKAPCYRVCNGHQSASYRSSLQSSFSFPKKVPSDSSHPWFPGSNICFKSCCNLSIDLPQKRPNSSLINLSWCFHILAFSQKLSQQYRLFARLNLLDKSSKFWCWHKLV